MNLGTGDIVYCVCRDVGGRYAVRLELVSVHNSKKVADAIVAKKNGNPNTPFAYCTKRKTVK